MAGYSPGLRAGLNFDWAKNLQSQNLPNDVIKQMNYKTSSAFAFFWNLCWAWLPGVIIADFNNFMAKTGILTMDGNHHLNTIDGDYEATIGGLTYKFNNVQLAPPQGAMAVNYAQYDLCPVLQPWS